jgi:hypothetical protein
MSNFDPNLLETWVMPGDDTWQLLANADVIDGIKYLPIEEVIAYKLLLDRTKDRSDLSAIGRRRDPGFQPPHLKGNHGYPTSRDHREGP